MFDPPARRPLAINIHSHINEPIQPVAQARGVFPSWNMFELYEVFARTEDFEAALHAHRSKHAGRAVITGLPVLSTLAHYDYKCRCRVLLDTWTCA